MNDLITAMRTYVRVVEAGSFTAVAAELCTTQPTISRQVASLEQHLGTRLITRTTRALAMTEDGRVFYEHALRSLETLAEAEAAVGRRKGRPSGTLRLTVPVVFGRLHVVPRLALFAERYPDIRVDLIMNDAFSDLVEEAIDLAIRVGEITDPGLVAKRIGITRRVTVAAPAYLAKCGEPTCPGDLAAHDCIVYTRLVAGHRWSFTSPDGPVSVDVAGRFRVNNSEGVREGVIAGLGIGVVPIWAFRDEIETGRVKIILPAHRPMPLPMQAVYPSRRFVPLKVRAAIDYLRREFLQDARISGAG